MRTIHWVALVGSIAAAVIACSSEDDGNDPIGPGKGGSAGGVVGKGGASNKGGSAGNTTNTGGTTNEGGAAGSTNEGGAAGSTAQGGAAGGGACDPATQTDSAECDACFKDACGTEAQACQANTSCMAIIECMQGCSDDACTTKCITDNPDGKQALFTYFGCGDTTCHDECYCPGCRFGTTDACSACLGDKCLTQCNGCDKNTECMAMVYCFSYTGCYDMTGDAQTACMDACAQLFQGGVTPFNDFGTCADGQCTTDCQ